MGRLTGGVEQLLRDAGVTVATGTARFATARRMAVTLGDDAAFYEFGSVILATGSRCVELPDLPFDGERILDSTAALALRHVPRRLTVVGGGYIGVELGGAFAKLGADVTIVELADQLLPGMPLGLARTLERALRARGLDHPSRHKGPGHRRRRPRNRRPHRRSPHPDRRNTQPA